MIRRPRPTLPIVLAIALAVGGCAAPPPKGTPLTAEQRQEAQRNCMIQYTAVGGIGGALLGNLLGGNRKGTAIGAVAGAALGYAVAWGQCLSLYSDMASYPVADAGQTARQVDWQPARGNEVKIQAFTLAPAQVKPGAGMKLGGNYYVMGPAGASEVKVVETRTVHYFDPAEKGWKELGSVDQNVTAALGTRRAEGNIDLPADVPEGRYRVTLKVSALGRSDSAAREVIVRKA